MPRILFGNQKGIQQSDQKKIESSVDIFRERDLMRTRSRRYVSFLNGLDHKTLTSTQGWNELMDLLQEEFGTAELSSLPLGFVSKCFLGHPYEVHILDLSAAQIIHHYKINEPMPAMFEKARSIAKHDAYALIEIYTDKVCLIRADGSCTKL